MGTNNVDHCARNCHAPTVAGLATSFDSGAMTNSISEIAGTELSLLIGINPTEAYPVIGYKMRQAARRGAKLIVVDPRRTELAEEKAAGYTTKDMSQHSGLGLFIIKQIVERHEGLLDLIKPENFTSVCNL